MYKHGILTIITVITTTTIATNKMFKILSLTSVDIQEHININLCFQSKQREVQKAKQIENNFKVNKTENKKLLYEKYQRSYILSLSDRKIVSAKDYQPILYSLLFLLVSAILCFNV